MRNYVAIVIKSNFYVCVYVIKLVSRLFVCLFECVKFRDYQYDLEYYFASDIRDLKEFVVKNAAYLCKK